MTTKRILLFICIIACVKGNRLRIINGDDAAPGEFPFQVSLQSLDGDHFCSGSILNEDYVITAAHCIRGQVPNDLQVAVGLKLSEPKSIHKVIHMIAHPKYNLSDSVINDIAILRVTPSFVLNTTMSSVTLPKFHETIPESTNAKISGWGRITYPGYGMPDSLKKTNVIIINNEDCQQNIRKGFNIYPGQVCTLETTKKRGPCDYDSGGPMTINGNKLIGIISWLSTSACAVIGSPSIYTRVSEYIDWIEKNTKLNEIF